MPDLRPLRFLVILTLCAACAPALASSGSTPSPAATLSPVTPDPVPTLMELATAGPATPTLAPPTRTPVLLPSPTAEPEIDLLFTGDINPARCVYSIAKAAGDMALPYRALADVLQGADLTIGSLDASLSDVNPPSPCAEYHRNLLAPAETAQGLGFAGFDVITVATNHIQDCGLVRGCQHQSMLDTLANLRAVGIQPVGAGRNLAEATAPVIVEVRGVRFAFVAFTAINGEVWATAREPGAAPFLKEVYLDAVRRAREQADVVIAMPHWGREFTGEITWEQALGAQALVEAGATLVIGNNPHHVQGVKTYPNGAMAAYALGNFVFDMQWSDGTQYTVQGLMARAKFRGAQLQGLDLIPIHIYDNFQPRLAPPDEAVLILQDVADSLKTEPPVGK